MFEKCSQRCVSFQRLAVKLYVANNDVVCTKWRLNDCEILFFHRRITKKLRVFERDNKWILNQYVKVYVFQV